MRHLESAHSSGPRQLFFRKIGAKQNALQPRRLRWVEINAAVVQHQRQRRNQVRPQPHRAHKAVFHAQQPGAGALGQIRHTCRRLAPPKHQSVVWPWGEHSSRAGIGHKHYLARVERQQRLDVGRLPAPKAHRHDAAGIAPRHLALAHQPVHHIEDGATLVRDRVQIAGVVKIGRSKQLIDRALAGAPCQGRRIGLAVVRRAPTRIPRHAKHADGFARQQGFEPHRRSHHIDPVHALDQAQRIDRLAQHHGALPAGSHTVLHLRQIAALAARCHFGVCLDVNRGLRVFSPRRRQHGGKGGGIGPAQRHTQVACGLVYHQHAFGIHSG